MIKEYIPKNKMINAEIDICMRTTNLGERNESILRSIVRQPSLSPNQIYALHEMAVQALEITEPYCKVLFTAKFDEPEPMEEDHEQERQS